MIHIAASRDSNEVYLFHFLCSDPVAIINTPAVQEFLIGQTVEVICQVKGDPAPDIIWSKGSEDKLGVVKGMMICNKFNSQFSN